MSSQVQEKGTWLYGRKIQRYSVHALRWEVQATRKSVIKLGLHLSLTAYQQMALHLVKPIGEVINLEISGVHSEWAMYHFDIVINSPGKKVSITHVC